MSTGAPGLLLTLALAWIYLAGGRLLEAGTISLGTFVAFVLYQGRLFGPAQGLLGLVRNLQEARVSLARVAEVLGADDADAGGDPRVRDADVVRATTPSRCATSTFAYAGKPPVLRGVDLARAIAASASDSSARRARASRRWCTCSSACGEPDRGLGR